MLNIPAIQLRGLTAIQLQNKFYNPEFLAACMRTPRPPAFLSCTFLFSKLTIPVQAATLEINKTACHVEWDSTPLQM